MSNDTLFPLKQELRKKSLLFALGWLGMSE